MELLHRCNKNISFISNIIHIIIFLHRSPVTNQNVARLEKNVNLCSLGKDPATGRCNNCWVNQSSRVSSKISRKGWIWIILCFFAGGWPLIYLVSCMDGFKIFHHYCPSCNANLGIYKPTFSSRQKCTLVILTLLSILLSLSALIALVFYCKLLTQ